MATLGELLNSIKNTGLNAQPTGESPYTSENVAGGTDSPMAQPGIDDFSNVSTVGDDGTGAGAGGSAGPPPTTGNMRWIIRYR